MGLQMALAFLGGGDQEIEASSLKALSSGLSMSALESYRPEEPSNRDP